MTHTEKSPAAPGRGEYLAMQSYYKENFPEIPDLQSLAKRFAAIFAGRKDAWGTLQGGCVKESLKLHHITKHLAGKESLGRYPLLQNGKCKWACIDFDFKSEPNREVKAERESRRFAKKLFELGLKSYWIERSKSGLMHLWLFFSDYVEAREIRRILQFAAQQLGLKVANGIVEIFPKQDELSDGQVGNYVHLPYFGASNGQPLDRRVMIDAETFTPIALESFLEKAEQSLITPSELDEAYESLPEDKPERSSDNTHAKTAWDLKRDKIISIFSPYWAEGLRQELALSLSGFLAKSGVVWEETEAVILSIAAKCDDTETHQRIGAIKSTYEKGRNGEQIKGYSGLAEMLSPEDLLSLSGLFTPRKIEISFPNALAEAAYHGVAGEIVRTIEPHSEADPVALLLNFLTAFGSIIGDKAHFRVEADKHPMRLFCALVGDTSKRRKGTSWGYTKRLFESLDPEWAGNIQTGLSSGEGVIWAVRDEIIKKQPVKEKGRVIDYEEIIVDGGIDEKRMLVIESELATTLRAMERDGNTLSPVIRCAWDSGNLQTLTKNSPAKATGAHISIIGHITREELVRLLTATEAGNGFGNRFLGCA